jgi:hypothetical protein
MAPTSSDDVARGHGGREFIYTCRTLRDDQGHAVKLPTKALSDSRSPFQAGATAGQREHVHLAAASAVHIGASRLRFFGSPASSSRLSAPLRPRSRRGCGLEDEAVEPPEAIT